MNRRRIFCLLVTLVMGVLSCVHARALDASTLHNGSRGTAVKELQQALIDLGFLKGSADGIFGNKTENAVRSFQRANKLTVDGLAGKKTQSILFAARSTTSSASSSSAQAQASQASASQAASSQSSSSASSASDDTLFSGNYNSLRIGSAGNRVKILQSALITLKYLNGKADGIFGNQTKNAVLAFQKQNKLTQDGIAGRKTLTALESAVKAVVLDTAAEVGHIVCGTDGPGSVGQLHVNALLGPGVLVAESLHHGIGIVFRQRFAVTVAAAG